MFTRCICKNIKLDKTKYRWNATANLEMKSEWIALTTSCTMVTWRLLQVFVKVHVYTQHKQYKMICFILNTLHYVCQHKHILLFSQIFVNKMEQVMNYLKFLIIFTAYTLSFLIWEMLPLEHVNKSWALKGD